MIVFQKVKVLIYRVDDNKAIECSFQISPFRINSLGYNYDDDQ